MRSVQEASMHIISPLKITLALMAVSELTLVAPENILVRWWWTEERRGGEMEKKQSNTIKSKSK